MVSRTRMDIALMKNWVEATNAGDGADSVIKGCACGKSYNEETWRELRLLGYCSNGKEGPDELLEVRKCSCGSSISINLGTEPDTAVSRTIPESGTRGARRA